MTAFLGIQAIKLVEDFTQFVLRDTNTGIKNLNL